mgnify:CR=1 FL=1
MSDALTERRRKSTKVYSGVLLHVFEDTVELPDGNCSRREYIKHPGASLIVPVFEDGSVLMERQFRYPVDQVIDELPAGKLDADESPIDAAKRELAEETGYSANDWIALGTLMPCVGYSDERIHVFLAQGLTLVGQSLDDEEFIETFTVPFNELYESALDGRIQDAKTLIAIFWAKKFL